MRIKLIDLLKKQGIEIGMKGCYSAKDAYEWIMQQEVDIPEELDEEEIIKLLQGAYLDFTGMSINHDLCSRMARYVCQKFCAPEKEGLDKNAKEWIAERLLQWIPKRIDSYKMAEEIVKRVKDNKWYQKN